MRAISQWLHDNNIHAYFLCGCTKHSIGPHIKLCLSSNGPFAMMQNLSYETAGEQQGGDFVWQFLNTIELSHIIKAKHDKSDHEFCGMDCHLSRIFLLERKKSLRQVLYKETEYTCCMYSKQDVMIAAHSAGNHDDCLIAMRHIFFPDEFVCADGIQRLESIKTAAQEREAKRAKFLEDAGLCDQCGHHKYDCWCCNNCGKIHDNYRGCVS